MQHRGFEYDIQRLGQPIRRHLRKAGQKRYARLWSVAVFLGLAAGFAVGSLLKPFMTRNESGYAPAWFRESSIAGLRVELRELTADGRQLEFPRALRGEIDELSSLVINLIPNPVVDLTSVQQEARYRIAVLEECGSAFEEVADLVGEFARSSRPGSEREWAVRFAEIEMRMCELWLELAPSDEPDSLRDLAAGLLGVLSREALRLNKALEAYDARARPVELTVAAFLQKPYGSPLALELPGYQEYSASTLARRSRPVATDPRAHAEFLADWRVARALDDLMARIRTRAANLDTSRSSEVGSSLRDLPSELLHLVDEMSGLPVVRVSEDFWPHSDPPSTILRVERSGAEDGDRLLLSLQSSRDGEVLENLQYETIVVTRWGDALRSLIRAGWLALAGGLFVGLLLWLALPSVDLLVDSWGRKVARIMGAAAGAVGATLTLLVAWTLDEDLLDYVALPAVLLLATAYILVFRRWRHHLLPRMVRPASR